MASFGRAARKGTATRDRAPLRPVTEFVECVRLKLPMHACVIVVVPRTLIKRKFVPRSLIWLLSSLDTLTLCMFRSYRTPEGALSQKVQNGLVEVQHPAVTG